MMKHFYCILLMVSLTFPVNVIAQSNEDKKRDIENFKTAIKMSDEAEEKWNEGNMAMAEKLFTESSKTYLTEKGLNQLANLKIKIGDINGANASWRALQNEAKKYEEVIISKNLKYVPVGNVMSPILKEQGDYNAKNGNIQEAYKAYLLFENYVANVDDFGQNYYNLSLYACETGNLETAQRAIDSLKVFYSDKKNTKKKKVFLLPSATSIALKKGTTDLDLYVYQAEANLFMAKGEYQKAIDKCIELENEDKGMNTTWKGVGRLIKAEAYALMGNRKMAGEALESTLKHVAYGKKSPNVRYVMGLINLLDKEYLSAIDDFNAEMNFKTTLGVLGLTRHKVWGKYRYYTKRAEAHIGLNDYDKARKDFEAALLYNPDYTPAINGLANLEGRILTQRKTDNVAPVIVVTEPSLSRGLIVKSAGNEITIRGTANDPGGLKSVMINGEKVYSQEGGVFWGNVKLKEGMNKLIISATDFSGNSGEEVFNIERTSQASGINAIPIKEGRNFALLIGSQNYEDSNIPSLENPIPDVIKLKLILKNNYNFTDENIITLFNPESSDIKKQFLELSELVLPEDNLVIFYAGHGIWVEKEKKGYWLMTDAKGDDVNSWLPNKEVLNMIANLPARHILLITDACFSGSVFKTRGLGDMPASMQQLNEKISRVAITSGNDTEVPDKSVFMKYLVKALSENKEKHLTAQKMFVNQIIEAVMTETKTEPRYGTLEMAGHVGGDYIFKRKN